jgi:hypothetical protein
MPPAPRTQRPTPRAPLPSRPDRLRALAAEVERLGNSARGGPENFVVAKLSVAREMRELARELEWA